MWLCTLLHGNLFLACVLFLVRANEARSNFLGSILGLINMHSPESIPQQSSPGRCHGDGGTLKGGILPFPPLAALAVPALDMRYFFPYVPTVGFPSKLALG